MEGRKCLVSDFENDGLQKKDHHPLFGRKMRSLSQEPSIVFVSLVRQVWAPCHIKSGTAIPQDTNLIVPGRRSLGDLFVCRSKIYM